MKNNQNFESRSTKPKSLAELEEIARTLTRTSLRQYDIPEDITANLVLGTFFDEDDRIFELYIPGDRPEDAQVISRVRVNIFSGQATIEIFLKRTDTGNKSEEI